MQVWHPVRTLDVPQAPGRRFLGGLDTFCEPEFCCDAEPPFASVLPDPWVLEAGMTRDVALFLTCTFDSNRKEKIKRRHKK